jgi:hypothetical protein
MMVTMMRMTMMMIIMTPTYKTPGNRDYYWSIMPGPMFCLAVILHQNVTSWKMIILYIAKPSGGCA